MFRFKLPTESMLTAKQKLAIKHNEPIAITGAAGSGKSVVLMWRHILNYSNARNKSILLTYTKSLHYYLKDSIISYANDAKINNEKIANNIFKAGEIIELANSWKGQEYDEILIDEAQDIPEYCTITKIIQIKNNWGKWLDNFNKDIEIIKNYSVNDTKTKLKIKDEIIKLNIWILSSENKRIQHYANNSIRYICRFSKKISYCADNTQILYPEKGCTEKKLNEIIQNHKKIRLHENFRNTYKILNFVKYALPFNIPHSILDRLKENNKGSEPIFFFVENKDKQFEILVKLIEQFNDGSTSIAVLSPHIAEVNSIKYYLQKINKSKLKEEINFSKYTNTEKDFIGIDFVHLTTYKSAKGLEFDVVIMPYFDNFFKIGKEKILTNEDFYVAFTRAKKNLFLIGAKDIKNIPENILQRQIIK